MQFSFSIPQSILFVSFYDANGFYSKFRYELYSQSASIPLIRHLRVLHLISTLSSSIFLARSHPILFTIRIWARVVQYSWLDLQMHFMYFWWRYQQNMMQNQRFSESLSLLELYNIYIGFKKWWNAYITNDIKISHILTRIYIYFISYNI